MKWNKTLFVAFAAAFVSIGAYTSVIHAQEDIEEITQEVVEPEVVEVVEESILIEEELIFEDTLPEEKETTDEPVITGIQNVGNYNVIYDNNGNILKGLQIYLGHAYYLNLETGAIQTGFVDGLDGKVYYCNEEGWIQTGEFTVGKVTVITDKRGSILKSDVGSVPYFNQKDSRWANTKIGLGTVGSTGCAMNVMTSIVNYLKNTTYTPVDVGKVMYGAGYYNKKVQGTLGTAWPYMAQYYDLDFQIVPTAELAEQALKKGYLIAAGMGVSEFTGYSSAYTHEILYYGYNGNGYTNVYDPNNISLNGTYTLSHLYAAGMGSWDPDDKYLGTSYFAIGVKPVGVVDVSIGSNKVIVYIPDQQYTGAAIIPVVYVEKNISGTYKPLVLNRDFIIKSASSNVNGGTASLILEGIGTYTGTRSVTFNILGGETTGTDTPGTDTPTTPVVQIISNGTYVLSSGASSGYCLNNSYGSKDANQQYIAYQRSGSNNQKYVITYVGDGYYTIKNAASNMYICCNADPATTSRQYVNQTTNGSSTQAQWFIEAVGTSYIIRSKMNMDYVINIDAEELTGPREVILYQYVPGDSFQQWNFEKL